MYTEQKDYTLMLEEWGSIDRQIKNLVSRKKAIEEELADSFSTKDGALSTVHHVDDFELTKSEGFKYTLNKKSFNSLTEDQKKDIMSLGAVQEDIKISEAKVRNNAKEYSGLLSLCITEKPVNEIKIKQKEL